MSDTCCDDAAENAVALAARHRSVLWTVLAINLGPFAAEAVFGLYGASSALLGDSLDMLGDSFVYGASLYVVGRNERSQARVALGKGALMGLLAAAVLFDASVRVLGQAPPAAALVSAI